MALLWWIDAARNNLLTVGYSYADIQRQLDRYNKIFEVYAKASPETQMRAASVMRQALDEYNWLKKQQEENAIKIYELQSRVDYYNKSWTNNGQISQSNLSQNSTITQPIEERNVATEQVPVVSTATPWALNNNVPTTNMEVNAIDTNQTMNVSTPTITTQNTVNPTAPIWTQPKYPNTTISPVSGWQTTTIKRPNYWPGSVVAMPSTWGIAPLSINRSTLNNNNNALSNSLKNYVRKGAKFLYRYLNK